MTRYGLDTMADNTAVTVITESRNLRSLPFRIREDQLSTGKAWEDWLESIEREFRYFRIKDASDRKDALIIYGGQEISRLEKSLPDPEDRGLNIYEKLRTKLSNYFSPKRNKHYCRYMFLKMRPQVKETTVAYATRLREKAHDCDFKSNHDERILEHLIQTIENQTLIQKCISKSWTLQEFLSETGQIEAISEQVHDMMTEPRSKEIAKVTEQRRSWESRYLNIGKRFQRAEPCSYCGLVGAHVKGRNCPAYGTQCEICRKFNHYSSVCRANTSPTDKMYAFPRTHDHRQKKGVMKAEEIYASSESSDDDFLAQSVGHLRVKTVKKSNSLNKFHSEEISMLLEQVAEFGKELETAKEVIKNLVTQQENYRYFHPSMHIDYKMPNFQKESAVFSKSDSNEERNLQEHVELKVDAEIDEEMKGIYHKTPMHSDIEKAEQGSHNQGQKQRIPTNEKQMTEYKTMRRRRSRMKAKRL